MSTDVTIRRASIDWMRGFVMVLMTVDHASMHYNPGRVSQDSAASYVIGTALPMAQFLTRWATHLCAPTFVFLAGTSLALSTARKQRDGTPEREITRDFVIRGGVIVLLDLVYISMLAHVVLLQVLYAIGASMIAMAWLRRLPTPWLLMLALLGIGGGELVTGLVWDPHGAPPPIPIALLLAPHMSDSLLVIYPVLPWLWMMLLGWCFGRYLLRTDVDPAVMRPARLLQLAGVLALLLFTVVRYFDGYGNMFLHRVDGSLVQWLHVSKYPPGMSYTSLELGIMALLLAAFMWLEPRSRVNRNGPLLVFGQTALMFYVLHQFLLGASAAAIGFKGKGGLPEAYTAALIALVVLYPVCRFYRGYKQRHPQSLARYF